MNKTLMAISWIDSSGAAGLAADLKTFQTFRVYGAPVATAVAAQTTSGLQALSPVPMAFVGQQIEAVAADMPVHGIKVGALITAQNVRMVAGLLGALKLTDIVVVDPSLTASTGEALLEESALDYMKRDLIPLASVLTPSATEAEKLTGVAIADAASAKEAAKALLGMGCRAVIITSVPGQGPRSMDLMADPGGFHLFDAPRVATNNLLGIGDTFSAIVASQLVRGAILGEAVDRAKRYIAKAVQHPFRIGQGGGPLNHTLPM